MMVDSFNVSNLNYDVNYIKHPVRNENNVIFNNDGKKNTQSEKVTFF